MPAVTPPPAQPTPAEPAATPAEPAAAPTPYDYTGGMPGAQPGSRKLRASVALGVHAFAGEGWNEDEELPDDRPPQTVDFLSGSGKIEAIYDLGTNHAGILTVGGHSGSHQVREGIGPEIRTTSFSLLYGAIGARLQTPAARFGAYLQGNLGLGIASRQETVSVDTSTNEDQEIERDQDMRVTGVGAVTVGASYHVARGLDAFVEARYLRSPARFDAARDDAIDMGGVTAFAGFTLRL